MTLDFYWIEMYCNHFVCTLLVVKLPFIVLVLNRGLVWTAMIMYIGYNNVI